MTCYSSNRERIFQSLKYSWLIYTTTMENKLKKKAEVLQKFSFHKPSVFLGFIFQEQKIISCTNTRKKYKFKIYSISFATKDQLFQPLHHHHQMHIHHHSAPHHQTSPPPQLLCLLPWHTSHNILCKYWNRIISIQQQDSERKVEIFKAKPKNRINLKYGVHLFYR